MPAAVAHRVERHDIAHRVRRVFDPGAARHECDRLLWARGRPPSHGRTCPVNSSSRLPVGWQAGSSLERPDKRMLMREHLEHRVLTTSPLLMCLAATVCCSPRISVPFEVPGVTGAGGISTQRNAAVVWRGPWRIRTRGRLRRRLLAVRLPPGCGARLWAIINIVFGPRCRGLGLVPPCSWRTRRAASLAQTAHHQLGAIPGSRYQGFGQV